MPADATASLPLGVWRRGPSDWAYRIEVEGYGSAYGCGFQSRDEARARMEQVRREAEKAVADACTCGGIDAVPHATDHDPLCSVHGIEGWRDA